MRGHDADTAVDSGTRPRVDEHVVDLGRFVGRSEIRACRDQGGRRCAERAGHIDPACDDGPMEWGRQLVGQMEFYWDVHFRPRLEGLTDDEYRWAPVEGSWHLQPAPDGGLRYVEPASTPGLVTSLGWRLMHVAIGCFHSRASTFFGDGSVPDDAADMFDERHRPATVAADANGALAFLDRSYEWWHDGIAALDDDAMARPLGPRGAFFADESMGALVLHVNRELMHHGGEIGLLRDLYRARP